MDPCMDFPDDVDLDVTFQSSELDSDLNSFAVNETRDQMETSENATLHHVSRLNDEMANHCPTDTTVRSLYQPVIDSPFHQPDFGYPQSLAEEALNLISQQQTSTESMPDLSTIPNNQESFFGDDNEEHSDFIAPFSPPPQDEAFHGWDHAMTSRLRTNFPPGGVFTAAPCPFQPWGEGNCSLPSFYNSESPQEQAELAYMAAYTPRPRGNSLAQGQSQAQSSPRHDSQQPPRLAEERERDFRRRSERIAASRRRMSSIQRQREEQREEELEEEGDMEQEKFVRLVRILSACYQEYRSLREEITSPCRYNSSMIQEHEVRKVEDYVWRCVDHSAAETYAGQEGQQDEPPDPASSNTMELLTRVKPLWPEDTPFPFPDCPDPPRQG